MVTISIDDRLLAAYLFYGGILLLKMLLMSLITTFYRLKNKVCDIIAFLSTFPYETSSAAAALQNDFKKRYKRAAKGLAAAVAKNGCFALQGKPFDSDKQRCCSGAENSRITICAAKWLQSGFEF